MIMYTYTDIIINGLSDKEKAEKVKQKLEKCYDMKMIKEINHILDIKIKKVAKRI